MSSIKIRTKRRDGHTQIRLLITHPMANGRGKDKLGKAIPAKHITLLSITHNDLQILTAHLSASISKNPYFDFLLKEGNQGDTISVSWTDNLGETDSATYIVK
jgi:sulfur-oxidizing protein SoxZ